MCALAASAHAEALPETRATIELAATWTRTQTPGVVLGARSTDGVLAITRAQVPNPDAWRAKTRDAYVDQIVRGFADLRDVKRTISVIESVPVVDLEGTSARGPVTVRILLFRTYALTLAIEGKRAGARAIARTFVPPAARPEGSP